MRVKTGFTRRRAHKKTLTANKGYRMSKHRLYKVAREAELHAGQYAYAGRRLRKRDFRRLWIIRLKAALNAEGVKYSQFIHDLKLAKIELDRKILAEIALNHPGVFKAIVDTVKH